jgi:Ca-activated chloride channel family protein
VSAGAIAALLPPGVAELRFQSPWVLVLLPLAVLAGWLLWRRRQRADARLVLPRAGAGRELGRSAWVRLEVAVPIVRGIVLALLVLALARPQAGAAIEDVSTFGVDIMIALDVSGSMQAIDFEPNRLEVARQTVSRFVAGRPSDRIGLAVFGSVASTRSPLTLDHELLQEILRGVDFAPPDQRLTAIGMGLAAAVNRLRDSPARSRVVVLVTDGKNTAGQIAPSAAAHGARALGIRVHAIGVGQDGEVPVPVDYGPLGRRFEMQRFDLDEELLQEIARTTEGRYFRADDAAALESVFATIDTLEKTEIQSRVRVLYSELFAWVLAPALGLLALERALLATRLRRIP